MAKIEKTKKKIIGIVAIVAVIAIIVGSVCIYNFVPGIKKFRISVNKNDTIKTVYGWGTSACWWSQNVSNQETRTELAKLLYSKEGLGLNIYRYNVGGGFDENERTANSWRRAESFYYFNEKSKKWEFDFNRDKNAYAFLKEAMSYGCIDTVVLFANSPHYSFTVSGLASGSFKDNTCNLKKDCYDDYAEYMLTIAKHFIEDGIPVKFISPVNEPQWSWGGEWVGQEGCHYETDEMVKLMRVFSEAIEKSGLDIKLMAPESGEPTGMTNEYFEKLTADKTIRKNIGSLAYHSYWTDDYVNIKKDFGENNDENYPDLRVDMTEWCELPCQHDTDDFTSALIMARVIANDMQFSHSDSWSGWVAVNQQGITEDGGDRSDGLISANDEISKYDICMRYYALAHFSKFIPSGSYLLDVKVNMDRIITEIDPSVNDENNPKQQKSSYSMNYAAFLTPEGKTVLVIVNEGEAETIRLNIKGEEMTFIRSDADSQLENVYSGEMKKSIEIPACSISTIVVK